MYTGNDDQKNGKIVNETIENKMISIIFIIIDFIRLFICTRNDAMIEDIRNALKYIHMYTE